MVDDKKTQLILGVNKPIWLALEEEPKFKVLGWTATKPERDNGFINKGSVLVFDHIYTPTEGEEGLNFIEFRPGSTSQTLTAEFFQKEIDSFVKQDVLTLLDIENIEELSILYENVFIKYFDYIPGIKLSFDKKVFSPKDIYIIMGKDESEKSKYNIKIGEKVSLRQLLDVYSLALAESKIETD